MLAEKALKNFSLFWISLNIYHIKLKNYLLCVSFLFIGTDIFFIITQIFIIIFMFKQIILIFFPNFYIILWFLCYAERGITLTINVNIFLLFFPYLGLVYEELQTFKPPPIEWRKNYIIQVSSCWFNIIHLSVFKEIA